MTGTIDQDWIAWALKATGAVILFLLSLGVKDIRDRLKRSEEAYVKVESLYNVTVSEFEAVKERIKLIEDRIRLVEERLRLVEDRLTRIEVFIAHK